MIENLFANVPSCPAEGFKKAFVQRFDELQSKNAEDVAMLLLCSASGCKGNESLIHELIGSQAPALLPLCNGIDNGMTIEEVNQEFGNDAVIGKALDQFGKIDFLNLSEEQKAVKVGQLVRSVQGRCYNIEFALTWIRDDITQKQREAIAKKYCEQGEEDCSGDVYISDLANPAPEDEFLLRYNNVLFLPKANITAVKAQAKNGKTHLCAIFATALIMEGKEASCCGVYRIRNEPFKVLYIDTEQSNHCSDKLHRKILRMASLPTNVNSSNFVMVNLRKTKPKSRLKRIKELLDKGCFDVLLLDGIKDLAKSVNNEEEANEIIEALTDLIQEKKINLCTVLHQNPGNDSEKMRGHLGTELCNKAFEVFQTKKKDGVFNVLTTDRREIDLETFAFVFDDDGLLKEWLPNIGKSPNPKPKTDEEGETPLNGWEFWFELIGNERMSVSQLARLYEAKKGLKVGGKSGDKEVNKAIGKYLCSEGQGRTKLVWIIPKDEFEKQD